MGPAHRTGSGNARVVEMGVEETLVLTSVLQMGKGEEHESSFRGVIPLALDPVNCLDGESSLTILGSLDEKGGEAGAAFPLGVFPVDEAYVSLIVKGPDSPLGGWRPPAAHTCG